jgi:hypothetical protein
MLRLAIADTLDSKTWSKPRGSTGSQPRLETAESAIGALNPFQVRQVVIAEKEATVSNPPLGKSTVDMNV